MPARDARTRARSAASVASATPNRWVTPSEPSRSSLGAVQEPVPLTASQLLTAEQLAERWQVPRTQVWRLAREGAVPVVRIGRYMRFRADAIERWEEAQADA